MKADGRISFCPYCSCASVQPRGDHAVLCPRCGSLIYIFRSDDTGPETWHDIPGFTGFYQVSSHLRVRSLDRRDAMGRRLRGKPVAVYYKNNSLYCTLYKDGEHREHSVLSLYLSACGEQGAPG